MRFPINVSKQVRCPVCKKPGPGTDAPEPRPEAASLWFHVMLSAPARSRPVYLGGLLLIGWDSGITKHPQSRTSIGSSLIVAKKNTRRPDAGMMDIHFCSTRCMRKFMKEAIDELDCRIAAARKEVRKAKKAKK